jgi:hypothetical protein
MNAHRRRALQTLALAFSVGFSMNAFAGQELMGVETKFRAKIVKEKVRMAAQERKAAAMDAGEARTPDTARCGSQNIGNVDTSRTGANAPREVFVFAPNAINIVGRGSC